MNARPGYLARFAVLLFALLPLALAAAPAQETLGSPAPVAGVDYIEITDGAPFAPLPGRIEVAEVFGYTCIHCATFESRLSAWVEKLPADVHFTPVAAPFGGIWIPYAKAYFAAESLGLTKATHAAMFRALHDEYSLPVSGATPEHIAAFYARHGVEPEKFIATMASPQVEAAMERALQFVRRSGVEGTPSLVVNGKYRVIGGKTYDDLLRITEHLIVLERAALKPSASGKPVAQTSR